MAEKRKRYKDFVDKVGKCELCGSTRNLQLHHIVPLTVQEYLNKVELECEDNYVVVCCKCHEVLTPKNLLTKIGLWKSHDTGSREKEFYEELVEFDGNIDVVDVLDIFDKHFHGKY